MMPDEEGVAELTQRGMAEPVIHGTSKPLVVLTPFGEAHSGSVIRFWTFRERLVQVVIAAIVGGGAYASIAALGNPGIPAAIALAVIVAAIAALRPF